MCSFLGKVCYIPRWVAFNAQEIVEEMAERKRKTEKQDELKNMIMKNQELISKLLHNPKKSIEREDSDTSFFSMKSNLTSRQLSNPAEHSAPF